MRYIAISRDKSTFEAWSVFHVGIQGESKASVRRMALKTSNAWLDVVESDPAKREASKASIAANMQVLTEDKALGEYLDLLRRWFENTKLVYRAHEHQADLIRRIEELSGKKEEQEAVKSLGP